MSVIGVDGVLHLPEFAASVRAAPEPPHDPATLDRVHLICKKISVAKQLDAEYGADGSRKVGAAPLAAEGQAALCDALMRYGTWVGDSTPERHAMGLKCLNAALTLLDRSPGIPDAARLANIAEALLAKTG